MENKEWLEQVKQHHLERIKQNEFYSVSFIHAQRLIEKVEELEKQLKRSEKERWKTAKNLFNCRKKLKEVKQIFSQSQN